MPNSSGRTTTATPHLISTATSTSLTKPTYSQPQPFHSTTTHSDPPQSSDPPPFLDTPPPFSHAPPPPTPLPLEKANSLKSHHRTESVIARSETSARDSTWEELMKEELVSLPPPPPPPDGEILTSPVNRFGFLSSLQQAGSIPSAAKGGVANLDRRPELFVDGFPATSKLKNLCLQLFSRENPGGWVSRAGTFFSGHGLSESEKVESAAIHKGGEALSWFEWEDGRRHFGSREELKRHLLGRFRHSSAPPEGTARESNSEIQSMAATLQQKEIRAKDETKSSGLSPTLVLSQPSPFLHLLLQPIRASPSSTQSQLDPPSSNLSSPTRQHISPPTLTLEQKQTPNLKIVRNFSPSSPSSPVPFLLTEAEIQRCQIGGCYVDDNNTMEEGTTLFSKIRLIFDVH